MFNKEDCYLSQYGQLMVSMLLSYGIKDEDLALEVLHILIPEDELYDLEGVL